ncbi:uncharacterized protein LOC126900388 [Daktulosphaira vitifoliae]|uniref:uncharacterized protein LOC126900388 n=1 Tax=Daktulosphaira vitifoliae TaxID=58002 RepID=UPI0021AA800C|nr:uncharacterized protein LOC126900388 [Daktulosphaira vitifoliae]
MKQLVPSTAIAGLLVAQTLLLIATVDTPWKTTGAVAQDSPFELPVQLIGFPVIIMAVKMSNFVKKLYYTLSPSTYRSKTKREVSSEYVMDHRFDILKAQDMILKEMGPDACVYEKVCKAYAEKTALNKSNNKEDKMDWDKIISGYMEAAEPKKKYYMLSVFLGDVIGSPEFCSRIVRKIKRCEQKRYF